MEDIIRVFIGHDSKTPDHTRICRESILDNTNAPVLIETLNMQALRRAALYRRWHYLSEEGKLVDGIDGRPFSSEFAFTRFLIPALMQWRGWAIFCDSDFMFKSDIKDLWDDRDACFAIQVAQQDYKSKASVKKGGFQQSDYPRKNWSSLMMWNLYHPAHLTLTQHVVNTFPGDWLHRLNWLDDKDVGKVDPTWNWIEGTTDGEPKAVHFTMGTPDIPGYRNAKHSSEWLRYSEKVQGMRG